MTAPANKVFINVFYLWLTWRHFILAGQGPPANRARDTILNCYDAPLQISQHQTLRHVATELIRPKSGDIMSLGLSFSNVCMRPEFMTSMSCDSIYCMCGAAWSCSSRWLMMQLTNAQHPCVLAFAPEMDILNILCDYQFVFPVLDELYASNHAWCSRWCSKTKSAL